MFLTHRRKSTVVGSSAVAAGRRYRIGGGYAESFGFLVGVFEDVEQLLSQCIGLAERFEEVEAGHRRRMVDQIRFEEPAGRYAREGQLVSVDFDLEAARAEQVGQ